MLDGALGETMKEKGSAVYQVFMLVISVYVLGALILEVFIVEDDQIKAVLRYIDLVACLFFLLDFFVNLFTADSKLKYLKWGWIDLVSSIPTLDALRWGRLSRVVRIVRFFRSLKSIRLIYSSLRDNKVQSLTLMVALITFVSYSLCTSLILYFERSVNAEISQAKDALWWAFLNIMNAKITIASVVTREGQFMTILLNKVGLLLFAYLNGLVIAWLLRQNAVRRGSHSG